MRSPRSSDVIKQVQQGGAIAKALRDRRQNMGYQKYLREKAYARRSQTGEEDDFASTRNNPVKMVNLIRSLSEAGGLTRSTDPKGSGTPALSRAHSGTMFARQLHRRVSLFL